MPASRAKCCRRCELESKWGAPISPDHCRSQLLCELDAADLAEEGTLNATDRVKLALEEGSAYPLEIAKVTGLSPKTVRNSLTKLRKSGEVVPTGKCNERGAEQVRLVSHRPTYTRDEDRDTNREDHATSDAGGTP